MPFAEAGHTLHLCQHMAQRGVEVHLLTGQGAVRKNLSFHVHPIMRDWSWRDMPRFVEFTKQCSPNAVLMIYIGFIYNDFPMVTFAPSICKRALPGTPFVTQFENVMGAPTGRCSVPARITRKVMKFWVGQKGVDYEFGTLLRDSDKLIVLSAAHQERLIRLYAGISEKCIFIPPPPTMTVSELDGGGPRQRGRSLLRVESHEFVLVYFGYIYPSKGLETLLKALRIVKDRRCIVRLVIAGGVPGHLQEDRQKYLAELKRLAEKLKIDHDVTWTGPWDWDSDVATLSLRAADVCVLPFDYGVSMNNSTFAAAAAHGLPIISTRAESLERFFLHGENVFLCSPRDPESLAEAIQILMERSDVRDRLSAGALKLSDEWFSWDKAAERTLATFSGHAE